jgi:hypothetical protein
MMSLPGKIGLIAMFIKFKIRRQSNNKLVRGDNLEIKKQIGRNKFD